MTRRDAIGDVELHADVVYLSPRGKRCRLLRRQAPTVARDVVTLLYDLVDGTPAPDVYWSQGFTLARENWHLLRRVA